MINSIKEWFKAAKPNPSTLDVCVQIGCHYNEFAVREFAVREFAVQTLRDRYMISTDVTLHGGV